ncbi:MAG: hypothetical protein HY565_04225 [Candidatus Kerfeldbacteria bacterium]|nr:hypothetical protein [Candidatus Kerfeldbacteria bacterium]
MNPHLSTPTRLKLGDHIYEFPELMLPGDPLFITGEVMLERAARLRAVLDGEDLRCFFAHQGKMPSGILLVTDNLRDGLWCWSGQKWLQYGDPRCVNHYHGLLVKRVH